MIPGWYHEWNGIPNALSFAENLCLGCRRLWDAQYREEGRPICVFTTVFGVEAEKRVAAGWNPRYDNTQWIPLQCGVRMEK